MLQCDVEEEDLHAAVLDKRSGKKEMDRSNPKETPALYFGQLEIGSRHDEQAIRSVPVVQYNYTSV